MYLSVCIPSDVRASLRRHLGKLELKWGVEFGPLTGAGGQERQGESIKQMKRSGSVSQTSGAPKGLPSQPLSQLGNTKDKALLPSLAIWKEILAQILF